METFKDSRKQKFSKHNIEKVNLVKNEKQMLQKANRLRQRAQATQENLDQFQAAQERGDLPEWRDHKKVMKKTEGQLENLEILTDRLAKARRIKGH